SRKATARAQPRGRPSFGPRRSGNLRNAWVVLLRGGRRAEEFEEAGARYGDARDADAAIPERVLHGAGDHSRRRDDAALAHALDAKLVDGRGEVQVVDLERRHVVGPRYRVVHERAGQELSC